ncbi:NAD-dependent malic enzyme 1 [Striga asiatica]|uniref:NAD-dependent malic enzyme 1 n=1 Tax=Striga asiatica TaxID=4170 RepID=A0A5A7RB91_STRAF|nr:NAD-dependent malic enzyme 1 [Striga asiatica]
MGNCSRQMRISLALLRRLQSRQGAAAAGENAGGARLFTTTEGHRPTIVHKWSLDILHDPWFNKLIFWELLNHLCVSAFELGNFMDAFCWHKGTAFSMTERDRLHLRGLLPPNVMSSEQQIECFIIVYLKFIVCPSKMKIVVAGAGSAGIGVLNAARKTMARMLGDTDIAFESARSQFWVVDANGLITEARERIDPDARPFARKVKETERRQGLTEGAHLVDVVSILNLQCFFGIGCLNYQLLQSDLFFFLSKISKNCS